MALVLKRRRKTSSSFMRRKTQSSTGSITKNNTTSTKRRAVRKMTSSKRQNEKVKINSPSHRARRRRKLSKENKYILNQRKFRAWECDTYIIQTFKSRGWKYLGEPLKEGRENYPKSMYEAKKEKKFDKGDCLFWGDDDCGLALCGNSDKNIVSVIPNSHKALTKSYQAIMFNQYSWFPICFILPKQSKQLKRYIRSSGYQYWICKPRDSYGGKSMTVYKTGTRDFNQLFKRKSEFVIQRYIHDPYLMAGRYKFHLRCYMVVTNRENPFRAYLYKDTQVLFATVKFDLESVGEKKFNKYAHLTNYCISNEKKNRRNMYADKPGIGIGTEWEGKAFFKYLNKHEPKFSERKFWTQLRNIAKISSTKMMQAKPVVKGCKGYNTQCHFELYGMDILMDSKFNIYLTEVNAQPGMEWMDPKMENGIYNKHVAASNKVTAGVLNDLITLLGIDRTRKYRGKWLPLHF